MINNVNQSPSFGSTTIPLRLIEHTDNPYVRQVGKYFTVKGCTVSDGAKDAQFYADGLRGMKSNVAAYVTDFKNRVVRFIGFDDSSDNFIGRILKEICPEAEHVADVKPIPDSEVIKFDITL